MANNLPAAMPAGFFVPGASNDLSSRPYGQNVWVGKPTGVIGMSIGAIGTALAQQHLRNVLAYLDAPTMGQPEAFLQARDGMFDADGNVGAASRDFLQAWMDRYVAWGQGARLTAIAIQKRAISAGCISA